jgi:ribonucleoside-diphosphate reductase alpha chain
MLTQQKSINPLTLQQITTDVLLEKYAKGEEACEDDIFKRVAKGIAAVEKPKDRIKWEKVFYNNMLAGAVGAGRIMSAAGSGINATVINCFVQPIGDCIQGNDKYGNPGIYDALREAAETMKRGGGVGYDFSLIRPEDAWVKSIAGNSSGPCSYMDIFDVSCRTIESAGGRRGAQLAALRYNHPDIEKFIVAKRTPGRWNNFNVSVFVNDEFMNLKETDGIVDLIHIKEPSWKLKAKGAHQREDGNWVYKSIRARELWDKIMKSNYDFAEPGILFEDNINKDNNLRYCEYINTTNPCGEQPLPKYGCCDLGPIILTKFVKNPFKTNATFDFNGFATAVKTQVRFLDNVLDATMWPLPQQAKESASKRRIGVGFTGLANALAMLNVVYYNDDGLTLAEQISRTMRNSAYMASIELAKEKGAFPLLDKEKYLEEGTFASRLPDSIKEDIRKYGIRNSHLLSIAPVGTISLAFADNASNGIEPPFSLAYTRKKRMSDGTSQMYPVVDHSLRVWLATNDESKLFNEKILEAICAYKPIFEIDGKEYLVKQSLPSSLVTALEMTADQHLSMMRVVQPYIDSSISKTVNVPKDASFEEFKQIYDNAWKYKLKGVSTYRPNDILGSILSIEAPKKEEPVIAKVVDIDPYSIQIKRSVDELDAKIKQVKYSDGNGDHTLYIGMAFDDVIGTVNGKEITVKRPFEFFINSASSSVPIEWITAYTRTHSLLARSGLAYLAKALQDNQTICSNNGRIRYDWYIKEDGTKVPRYHGSDVALVSYAIQKTLISYGILDELGNIIPLSKLNTKSKPVENNTPVVETKQEEKVNTNRQPGKLCPECGDTAMIKKDGCSYCTSCGYVGNCS